MTEAGSHNYTLPGDDPADRARARAKPAPGYELRIFGRTIPKRELPAGEMDRSADAARV